MVVVCPYRGELASRSIFEWSGSTTNVLSTSVWKQYKVKQIPRFLSIQTTINVFKSRSNVELNFADIFLFFAWASDVEIQNRYYTLDDSLKEVVNWLCHLSEARGEGFEEIPFILVCNILQGDSDRLNSRKYLKLLKFVEEYNISFARIVSPTYLNFELLFATAARMAELTTYANRQKAKRDKV